MAIGSSTGEVTDAVNAGEAAKVAVEDNHMADMRVDKALGREGQSPFSDSEAKIIKDVIGIVVFPVGFLDAYYNAKTDEEKLLVLAEIMPLKKAKTVLESINDYKAAKKAEKAANDAIEKARIDNNIYRDSEYGANWTSNKKLSSNTNLASHWQKHKNEFPDLKSPNDYYRFATDFVSNPPAGTLKKVRRNGDTILYNPQSNTFAVKTKDGTPRTIFKPNPSEHKFNNNMEYFNAQ